MALAIGRAGRKYGNKKVFVGSIKFDSQKEARHYTKLKLLEQAGKIQNLQLQVPFILAPRVKFEGDTRHKPAVRYVADFVYQQDGKTVVSDVKGMVTPEYRIKKHLMKSVHNIDILEV